MAWQGGVTNELLLKPEALLGLDFVETLVYTTHQSEILFHGKDMAAFAGANGYASIRPGWREGFGMPGRRVCDDFKD